MYICYYSKQKLPQNDRNVKQNDRNFMRNTIAKRCANIEKLSINDVFGTPCNQNNFYRQFQHEFCRIMLARLIFIDYFPIITYGSHPKHKLYS